MCSAVVIIVTGEVDRCLQITVPCGGRQVCSAGSALFWINFYVSLLLGKTEAPDPTHLGCHCAVFMCVILA